MALLKLFPIITDDSNKSFIPFDDFFRFLKRNDQKARRIDNVRQILKGYKDGIKTRDSELETQALDWIEAILGEKIDRSKPYEDVLKDGIILCNLMNKLMPGCIKKIDKKGGGFALMQNIERFQAAAKEWGVPIREVFQTVDLWERKNIPQVTLCIHALGRVAQTRPDYIGPMLGPKMAEKQDFEFTEEQLRESQNAVSMQMGSNKGATQAGMSMGKQRMIYD